MVVDYEESCGVRPAEHISRPPHERVHTARGSVIRILSGIFQSALLVLLACACLKNRHWDMTFALFLLFACITISSVWSHYLIYTYTILTLKHNSFQCTVNTLTTAVGSLDRK